MYKLICMSFDGDYVSECESFETIDQAWERSANLGSKWYFYPFHFVVTESGKTIAASFDIFNDLGAGFTGKRVKTVARHFESVSRLDQAQNAGPEEYAFLVAGWESV